MCSVPAKRFATVSVVQHLHSVLIGGDDDPPGAPKGKFSVWIAQSKRKSMIADSSDVATQNPSRDVKPQAKRRVKKTLIMFSRDTKVMCFM